MLVGPEGPANRREGLAPKILHVAWVLRGTFRLLAGVNLCNRAKFVSLHPKHLPLGPTEGVNLAFKMPHIATP